MTDPIPARVAALKTMPMPDLKAQWRELFDTEPPPFNRRHLENRIAYRIQELAYGGLKPETLRRLEILGEQYDSDNVTTRRIRHDAKPVAGTRLIREYRGVEHTVTVLADGYEWEGRPYRSLSAIARAITGTRWNGLGLLWRQAAGECGMTKPITRKLRCAVYTRKSTEEGLEQEFNSLHAQREACEAYVASQRSEGWALIREPYDDGGFSGGTLERPGAEAAARRHRGGADRRRRGLQDRPAVALADGLLEARRGLRPRRRHLRLGHPVVQHHDLDGPAHAQHPAHLRPVRARGHRRAHPRQDRGIAAKGMWMGGNVPLGYEVKDRKLVVHEADAAIVRIDLRAVRPDRLGDGAGAGASARGRADQARQAVDKGYLYKLLNNQTYLGMAVHKGTAYPGEHEAIIDQDLWDKVHAILAENARTRSAHTRAQTPALLKGLIFGPTGAAMSPTHTRKGNRLYRYYVSQDVLKRGPEACPIGRVPAAEIEAPVIDQLRGIFRQPEIIVGTWRAARAEQDDITEDEAREALMQLDPLWDELFPAEQARIVQLLVERVDVRMHGVEVRLRPNGLAGLVREVAGSRRAAA